MAKNRPETPKGNPEYPTMPLEQMPTDRSRVLTVLTESFNTSTGELKKGTLCWVAVRQGETGLKIRFLSIIPLGKSDPIEVVIGKDFTEEPIFTRGPDGFKIRTMTTGDDFCFEAVDCNEQDKQQTKIPTSFSAGAQVQITPVDKKSKLGPQQKTLEEPIVWGGKVCGHGPIISWSVFPGRGLVFKSLSGRSYEVKLLKKANIVQRCRTRNRNKLRIGLSEAKD